MFLIRGKIANNIRDNKPSLISTLLVLVAGVIYGTVVFYLRGRALVGEVNYYYLTFTILIGFLYMVASQIGITLLLWSTCRIFKGSPKFMQLFSAVGYSFLPYGALAAVGAYYGADPFNGFLLATIVLACLTLLVYALTKIIYLMEGYSYKKAFLCVACSLIFFGSFVYVFGY